MRLDQGVDWEPERIKVESIGRTFDMLIPHIMNKPDYGYPSYNTRFDPLILEDGDVDEKKIELWATGTGNPQEAGLYELQKALTSANIHADLVVAGTPKPKLIGGSADSSAQDETEYATKLVIDTKQNGFDQNFANLVNQHKEQIIRSQLDRILPQIRELQCLSVAPETAQAAARKIPQKITLALTPLLGTHVARQATRANGSDDIALV